METSTPALIRAKKEELTKLTKLKESFRTVMDGSATTENVITEIETKEASLRAEIDGLIETCPLVSSDPVEANQYNLMQFQTLTKTNFIIDGIQPKSFTITAKYF